MRLSISHETTYHFEDKVRASIQYLRLTPHDSERQHVLSWQLDLPRPVRAQLDPFGNILHVLTLDEPHEAIIIGARGQVDIDELREAEHESQSAFPFLRCTRLTEPDDALRSVAEKHCHQRRDRSALIDLMHALNQYMTYSPGSTEVDTCAAKASICAWEFAPRCCARGGFRPASDTRRRRICIGDASSHNAARPHKASRAGRGG